jgi:repressor LexA
MSATGPRRRTEKGDVQRRRILRCFRELEQRTGYRPSYRQVAGKLGIGLSTVAYHLSVLEESGTVQRQARGPRTITEISLRALAAEGDDGVDVPFLEQIAAGLFREVQESAGETRRLPRWLLGSGDFFLLEVNGESMTGAAIFDGDLAVIRRQESAENGEIVAAQIEEHGLAQATLKTLRLENEQAWLVPQNPAFPKIPANQAQIKGKLVLTVHRH